MPVSKQDRFLSLYEPVHNRFERFCRARVYGKMEFRDLMNETLLVAFEKFDSLRSEAAFLSFIIGISIRILANNSKKKQEDYLNKEEHALLIANHGNATSLDTEIHFLHQALALLPKKQENPIMDKQPILDDLFAKACQQEPVVSFNETKAQFLKGIGTVPNPSIATRLRHFFTFKKWIIMFTLLSTIVLTIFISSTDETTQKPISSTEKTVAEPTQIATDDPVSDDQISDHQPASDNPVSKPGSQVFLSGYENGLYANLPTLPLVNRALPETDNISVSQKKQDDTDEYIFPKLTEEEISATNKQKKSMLKALSKFDKKSYAYIPTGTFDYAGKQVSVQSFYMQTTEVTNLEYRTFLFDLLIQCRKDDFLIAKPDQAQWAAIYG